MENLAFKQDLRSWGSSCFAQLGLVRACWSRSLPLGQSGNQNFSSLSFCLPYYTGVMWWVFSHIWLILAKWHMSTILVETRSFSQASDAPEQTENRPQEESSLGMSQVILLVVWGLGDLEDLPQFWTFIMRCKFWGRSSSEDLFWKLMLNTLFNIRMLFPIFFKILWFQYKLIKRGKRGKMSGVESESRRETDWDEKRRFRSMIRN